MMTPQLRSLIARHSLGYDPAGDCRGCSQPFPCDAWRLGHALSGLPVRRLSALIGGVEIIRYDALMAALAGALPAES